MANPTLLFNDLHPYMKQIMSDPASFFLMRRAVKEFLSREITESEAMSLCQYSIERLLEPIGEDTDGDL